MNRACRGFDHSSYSSQSPAQNVPLVLLVRLWTWAFCCVSSSASNHRRHSADLEAATDASHLCCIAAGRHVSSKARKGNRRYVFFMPGSSRLLVVVTLNSGTKMACSIFSVPSRSIGMGLLGRSRTKAAALALACHGRYRTSALQGSYAVAST